MGFFGGRTVIQISSSYMPLEDGNPDLVNQSVFHSILDNRDITDNLLDDINGSLGSRLGSKHVGSYDRW